MYIYTGSVHGMIVRRRKTYQAPPLRGMRFDAPFLRRENRYRRVCAWTRPWLRNYRVWSAISEPVARWLCARKRTRGAPNLGKTILRSKKRDRIVVATRRYPSQRTRLWIGFGFIWRNFIRNEEARGKMQKAKLQSVKG